MNKFKEILFLKNIKGVGKNAIYTKYWSDLKSANDVDELMEKLSSNPKLSEELIQEARRKAEKTYTEITDDLDIHIITVFDEEYPKKLNVMGNKKPLVLYVKGNIEALKKENISVVGTREPSKWSMMVEERLVKKIL